MSVLGIDLTPSGKGLYLSVYPLSRPNTDTVYTCLRTAMMETEGLLQEDYEFNGRFCSFCPTDYPCLSDDHVILLKVPE